MCKAPAEINDYALQLCADWQEQRAIAKAFWAQANRDTLFGNREGGDAFARLVHHADVAATRAEKILRDIERSKPKTARAAAQMLQVILEVIYERTADDETRLAQGDLGAILRNVVAELDMLGPAPLGTAGFDERVSAGLPIP